MVIPWDLVVTALLATAAGVLWARRRAAAAGHAPPTAVDLAAGIGLGALVGGRLVGVAVDFALSGVGPGLRGLLTLGAGLSTPGAVAGGLVVGWWFASRRGVEDTLWRAVVPPAAAGLALWSALAVARGDAAGVAAPFPLGWPLPGEAVTRVPVSLLEAVLYGAFALLVARGTRAAALPGRRLAAWFGVIVAGVHLVGSLARPAPPTVDTDLDALFGLLVLVAAVVVAAGAPGRFTRLAGLGAPVAAAALLAVAAFGGTAAERVEPRAGAEAGLEGAITATDTPAGPPPAWGEGELAAFVAAADGRPVVVNFWASWCPPCHAEAPALARTARAYGDDVAFVGVLVNDTPARAAAFAQRYGLPFPSVDDGGLRGLLGAGGLPTTVVLGADGEIAARVVGGIDARGLAGAIDRAAIR